MERCWRQLPNYRSPLLLVGEADPLQRQKFQDTNPECEPVPAPQDEDDLKDAVEVQVLGKTGRTARAKRETFKTSPKPKRGWLQHLFCCFPIRRRRKREIAAKSKKESMDRIEQTLHTNIHVYPHACIHSPYSLSSTI
ncbi:hypothetical protein AMEX_G25526 [Astyanax mexicanus]|uniref:Uncharacterized protein n=1 Tax=Astyanax mexicanus TaxID=7994 RepID=A0A8T2KW28_ASTMX|nr:hypothetical protein AMEX_G25526 [Astyanax mexicanus]